MAEGWKYGFGGGEWMVLDRSEVANDGSWVSGRERGADAAL